MAKVPGQASFITLIFSSIWTIIMLLIMIGGHVLMVLWAWEVVFENAGLQELGELLHLPPDVLMGFMAMAVISDIWAHFGSKKSFDESIERARRKR